VCECVHLYEYFDRFEGVLCVCVYVCVCLNIKGGSWISDVWGGICVFVCVYFFVCLYVFVCLNIRGGAGLKIRGVSGFEAG